MRRRELIGLLGRAVTLALAGPVGSRAQGAKVYRIGVLETVPVEQNRANFDALRDGLREHGYVEGQNLQIEYRSADGHPDRFPELVADLVRLPVDLIVTRGTPAARAAKAATSTIPIVMAAIGEPLGVGVVASLARPGGNVTGLSSFVTELSGKRVELLKETFPSIELVGFMQNMGNPVSPPQWQASETIAKALGISAKLYDVRSRADIERAFADMTAHPIGALSVGIDSVTQENAAAIVEQAGQQKLPTAYPSREFVDFGGLLSYGPSYPDLYFRAAELVDRILKGAQPGSLPVQQPTKLELVINMKTARALGLKLSPTLVARADEVIE